MTVPFPTFRYHPDPIGTGAFEQQAGVCRRCGEARGWVYVGAPYCTADLRDALCPWCVADGSAAATFHAEFTDLGVDEPGRERVSAEVLDELAHRTPGFSAWQQERWLFHCDDAAAYEGAVGWDELAEHPDAVQAVRDQVAGWGLDDDDVEAFVGSLDVDGASTAYLFRCLHCQVYLAYADAD